MAEPVPKRDRFSRKAMLCVWWNFEGIIHFELVPNNRAIDAELYSAQLDRMHTALAQKYPALVNRKRVILQQDNASPHIARRTKEKIRELESIDCCRIQPTVRTWRHPISTFSGRWHIFCEGGASPILTRSRPGVESFSPLTSHGTATGSNNLQKDGFEP